jgi:hypothetical protein
VGRPLVGSPWSGGGWWAGVACRCAWGGNGARPGSARKKGHRPGPAGPTGLKGQEENLSE